MTERLPEALIFDVEGAKKPAPEDFAGALQVLPDLAGLGGVNRLLATTKD